MDQTDAAVNIGLPLGICTATFGLFHWTSLPKWAAVLGGLVGGIALGLVYAVLIFIVVGFAGRICGAKPRKSENHEPNDTR